MLSWGIKPFTMYAISVFFLGIAFKGFIGPDAMDLVKIPFGLDLPVGAVHGDGVVVHEGVKMLQIPLWRSYLAGCILLGIAPCTAMVLVWGYLSRGNDGLTLVTITALLVTLVLLFSFKGDVITANPLTILWIAVPLFIQTVLIFAIGYAGAVFMKFNYADAAPAAMIGASNHFEVAIATSVMLFGLSSGAALATVVGVLFLGKADRPSLLYLNRNHGEEIEVELVPVSPGTIWKMGRGGVYGVMEDAMIRFSGRYETDPRVLATRPAARYTDFGAIASAPVRKKKLTPVDTWAGRGGFGSKLFQEHGIVGVIYGGTYVDEDFCERKVADQWFEDRYNQRMAAKDIEATTKYRYDASVETGGTFGVNYAAMSGSILAFNYRTIYWREDERKVFHQKFILDHYLKQFNEETIRKKQQKTCGEPCAAVCKKMNGIYKKDYEPYQALGPLCGIFDQRAAEMLAGHADMLGFDAIAAGGVLAWLMDCLDMAAVLCRPGIWVGKTRFACFRN